MRKYLSTLHSKPDHHKKRFALLASSTITLVIFGIWSLVTFQSKSDETAVLKVDNGAKIAEVGPLQSFSANIAASLDGLKASFNELKSGLEKDNFETKYKDLRNGALDTYGQ